MAMAMDMNTAFDLEVKQHCPQTEVVYDQFHVAARHGRTLTASGPTWPTR